MVKKGFMVQLWRIQQSQAIISLFFWGLTLAGVFYPTYFHEHFVNLGIVRQSDYFLGTMLLFLAIIGAFLLMGLIYDIVLKLWVEQSDVAVERNPYSKERLMAKEILFWRRSTVAIMKQLAKTDPSIQKDIDFVEKWIDKSLNDQKAMKEDVERIEAWIQG